MEALKYPIGKFEKPEFFTPEILQSYILRIEQLPVRLRSEVIHLSGEQLDTSYRPEGWNIRQVVHHLADSHMNAFIRFKLALTEEKPAIKPYMESRFAELEDTKMMQVTFSIEILHGLHARWVKLLRFMSDKEFKRSYIHPEYNKEYSLSEATGIYAWHGEHHLAHITKLKDARGWK